MAEIHHIGKIYHSAEEFLAGMKERAINKSVASQINTNNAMMENKSTVSIQDCKSFLNELYKSKILTVSSYREFLKLSENPKIKTQEILNAIKGFYANETFESMSRNGTDLLKCIKDFDRLHFEKIKSDYLNQLRNDYTK